MSRAAWLSVAIAFVVFVIAWKAIVVIGGLPTFILPPPETVAARFASAWLDGTVWPHFVTTIVEILLGFVVGVAVAPARRRRDRCSIIGELVLRT